MTNEAMKSLSGFLGLCARAGQLILGQDMCVAAIRKGTAWLALIDERASDNTFKRMHDSCQSHGAVLYTLPEGLISRASGKDGRMTAVIPTGGMAQKAEALLSGESPYGYTNE